MREPNETERLTGMIAGPNPLLPDAAQDSILIGYTDAGSPVRGRVLDGPGFPVTFAEALAEPPHGAVGAHEATDEAVCQRYHGMTRAEWNALPETQEDDTE